MNSYLIALAVIAYLIVGLFTARVMLLDGCDEVSVYLRDVLFGIIATMLWPLAIVVYALYRLQIMLDSDEPWFTLRRRSAKKMLAEIKERRTEQ